MLDRSNLTHLSAVSAHLGVPLGKWRGHIPFTSWLIQRLEPSIIVEHATQRLGYSFHLGGLITASGLSAICYAVDTWEGDEPPTEIFGGDLIDAGRRYADLARLICMKLDEASGCFPDRSIGLLRLDGRQTYEELRRCFEIWHPKLTSSAVVILHGIGLKDGSGGVGAWPFWEELVQRYPLHLEFWHSQGLGVLQLDGGQGARCLDWLSAASPERERFVAYFSAQGAEVERQHAERALQDAASLYQSSIGEPDREVAALYYALAARDLEVTEISGLRQALAERDGRIAALAVAAAERDAMLGSTSWHITQPLRALVEFLRGVSLRGGRFHKSVDRELRDGRDQATDAKPLQVLEAEYLPSPTGQARFANASLDFSPLVTYPDPSPTTPGRLTVLVDALGPGSLFSGTATAIVFALLLARDRGLRLRLVARDAPPEPATFGAVAAAHGVDYTDNIEFEYAPPNTVARALAVAANELIVTTSWRTTWVASKSFNPSRILYLLQDDERSVIPARDHLIHRKEFAFDPRLRYVVNTSALRDFLAADGMSAVVERGVSFEPAFPGRIYYRVPRSPASKRRCLLFTEGGTPRKLVLLGIDAVAEAIDRALLPWSEWEFHFVGHDIPNVKLPQGALATIAECLSWTDYGAVIRTVDIGLVLTDQAYPRRSVFDLAACGAIVVSNCGPQPSLEGYCSNILFSGSGVADMVAALGQASRLAASESTRQANDLDANIQRDWNEGTLARAQGIDGTLTDVSHNDHRGGDL